MTIAEFDTQVAAINSGSIAIGNGDAIVIDGTYTVEQLEKIVKIWKELRETRPL